MTFATGAWGQQAQDRSKKRLDYFRQYQKKRVQSVSPEYKKAWTNRKRQELIDFLGGKCIKCGFSDIRALQIDHINGDGHNERALAGPTYWNRVIKSIRNGEGRYQLLCANCNFIKRYENNEMRRGGESKK